MPIPVETIPDFFVAGSAFAESNSFVFARPDGRFVIGYTDVGGSGTVERVTFNAGGTVSELRIVAGNAAVSEDQLAGAALVNGLEVFAWSEGAAGARDVYATVRAANGLIVPASRFLVADGADDQSRPEVLGLGEDRFAVVWIDNATDRYRFAIHDISGFALVAPADVSAIPASAANPTFRQVDMTELANGNFVISYRPVPTGSDAFFRIFTPAGVAVTGDVNIDGIVNSGGPPAVAALADGRFVAMNGFGTEARIFNADGTASTGLFPVLSAGSLPQIAPLHDGRFMVVAEVSGGIILARVMFADGTPDGAEFQVNDTLTATAFGVMSVSAATLADGRVVVSWTTNQSGDLDVMASVFDPREAGLYRSATGFADDWVGTTFSDTILAGGGNDRIAGQDGNDYLYGEDGRDTLNGDTGSDRIYGGAGNDVINGGGDADAWLGGDLGNDSITGGLGNDRIDGGAGDDTLNGNDDDDTFTGGAGNDTVTGGNGNDLAFGDAGDDTLNGDAGNDSLRGGDGNDTIQGGNDADSYLGGENGDDQVFGGTGNDRVDGNAGNDQLFGGSDIDFITGGTGNDIVNGGAGNDILQGNDGNDTLRGELGKDSLTGGAGNDTFEYFTVDWADGLFETIFDFSEVAGSNFDTLRLQGVAGNYQFVDGAGFVRVIHIASGGSVYVNNMTAATIADQLVYF